MSLSTVVAIALAIVSTTLVNLAYLREHDAAAAMSSLSARHPLRSARTLLDDRAWLSGFAMEVVGFGCYAGAVGLASLALVQSIGAGGIGVLAFVSARVARRRLCRRHVVGVGCAVLGLLALGVSLVRDSGAGGHGHVSAVLLWIVGTIGAAGGVLAAGFTTGRVAVAEGIGGGLMFSIGDLSTKLATQGGSRMAFVITVIIGYGLGTSLLQLGYQRGGTLTVAGLATLLTNAIPIIAGTVLLGEGLPPGILGMLRVVAFAMVTAGAILLAAPDGSSPAAPSGAGAAAGGAGEPVTA